jgi:hypothetical protein
MKNKAIIFESQCIGSRDKKKAEKSFIYRHMHFISFLENIKIYIKTAPTCFGVRLSSGSLHMSLAKVTFIKPVKIRRYGLRGCVTACYIKFMVVYVPCAVQNETLRSTQHTHTIPPCTENNAYTNTRYAATSLINITMYSQF